jgi:hypothetical protein
MKLNLKSTFIQFWYPSVVKMSHKISGYELNLSKSTPLVVAWVIDKNRLQTIKVYTISEKFAY